MENFLYSVNEIRKIEQALHDQSLMKRAARALFDFFLTQSEWQNHPVCVFAGHGNNGGDALEFALLLHRQKINVRVVLINENDLSDETKKAKQSCSDAGVHFVLFSETVLSEYSIVVDGLFGIGFHGEFNVDDQRAARLINASGFPVLSIDVPSGLNADSGMSAIDAVRASHTVTFIALKPGLFMNNGVFLSGKIVLFSLEIDVEKSSAKPCAKLLSAYYLNHLCRERTSDWHKGKSGHVWIVGGDVGMLGAVILAGQAALRAGAGMVTVATHASHAPFVISQQAELMTFSLHDPEEFNVHLSQHASKRKVIAIGNGLGLSEWSKKIWEKIISINFSLILDGDGLNWLSRYEQKNDQWILTPHVMEAARLMHVDVNDINANRLHAVCTLQKRYGGVVVLKGAGTLIAAENNLPVLIHRGNAGMATAGMGDVLSGVIAAYVAQGLSLADAACLAVSVHASAGDRSAREEGSRGMIASDVLRFVRYFSNGFLSDGETQFGNGK